MICPFATYEAVGNHGGAMSAHLGLVLHVQQGNGSLYGYFNNPASQVSSHFWCSKTGALEQYVDTNVTAWAEAAGNSSYLSVETEGMDTEPLTDAQIATVGRLLAWAARGFGFPLVGPVAHGQKGFTPHCNPNGTPDPAWGNHPCPGPIRLAQMGAILSATAPTPPTPLPPPTTEEDEMADANIVVKEDGNARHVFVSEVTDATPPVVTVHHWNQAINGQPNFNWQYEALTVGS